MHVWDCRSSPRTALLLLLYQFCNRNLQWVLQNLCISVKLVYNIQKDYSSKNYFQWFLIHCTDNRKDPTTERIMYIDLMRERILIRFVGGSWIFDLCITRSFLIDCEYWLSISLHQIKKSQEWYFFTQSILRKFSNKPGTKYQTWLESNILLGNCQTHTTVRW